ncbi:hypothetical protein ACFZBU_24300 [Embleya sp. NPDC008237]|uniref:hypothetical protein n=1 Tax=Embleya sp. NPDC008237 TaxID=3363978 RepID=UPI0036E9B7B2
MNTHRPRGTCGVCGRRVAVTETHALWRHDDPGHARADDAPISCRGSWTPAAEATGRADGPVQLDLLGFGGLPDGESAVPDGGRPDEGHGAVRPEDPDDDPEAALADAPDPLFAGSAPAPADGSFAR